ncbi:GntR family transcriptional regulator [Mesorhizobium atlanticum]
MIRLRELLRRGAWRARGQGVRLTSGNIEPSAAKGVKSTLASAVYQQLRDDLLRGALEVETKLRVEWVVSRYGAGASPVREALNRLAAEGLLGRHDQRGFFLMPVSAAELEELTRTRCWLEERALREIHCSSHGRIGRTAGAGPPPLGPRGAPPAGRSLDQQS